jgi:hypothetical protein
MLIKHLQNAERSIHKTEVLHYVLKVWVKCKGKAVPVLN